MDIKLTEIECLALIPIASSRTLVNRCCNVKSSQVCEQLHKDIEYDGVISEYAFCKLFNLFIDITPEPRRYGYDCKLKNGVSVDVKATRHENGNLVVDVSKKNADVDIYVGSVLKYVNGNGCVVEFIGWCTKEELFMPENFRHYYSDCYFMTRNKLHDMNTIEKYETVF